MIVDSTTQGLVLTPRARSGRFGRHISDKKAVERHCEQVRTRYYLHPCSVGGTTPTTTLLEDRWKGFDPAGSALVLIDLINWQAHPQGASIQSIRNAGAHHHADYLTQRCSEILLPNLQAVLRAARAAGVQVIHARLASRHPSYRDIVPALQPTCALLQRWTAPGKPRF